MAVIERMVLNSTALICLLAVTTENFLSIQPLNLKCAWLVFVTQSRNRLLLGNREAPCDLPRFAKLTINFPTVDLTPPIYFAVQRYPTLKKVLKAV